MTTVMDYFIKKDLEKTDENTQTFGITGTTKTYTIYANALTHTLIVVIPDYSNTITTTITIDNADSNEIYNSTGLTQNTTHVIAVEKPLVGLNTITITLEGNAGGSAGTTYDVDTTLYLQGKRR